MAQKRARRRFTREYKAQAVQRVIESGRPLADIAAELDVSPGQLSQGRNEQLAAGSAASRNGNTGLPARARVGCLPWQGAPGWRRCLGALAHILAQARSRGMTRLSLETGSWDYFKPAVALYKAHGFVDCGPFEGYAEDPNSLFLTLDLAAR